MKIGLFWDEAISINSYYVKDGTGYSFTNNKPYTYHHTVSPQCYTATHNFNKTKTFFLLTSDITCNYNFLNPINKLRKS